MSRNSFTLSKNNITYQKFLNTIKELNLDTSLNSSKILDKLSFIERLTLMTSKEYICQYFLDKCIDNNIYIFKPGEIFDFFHNHFYICLSYYYGNQYKCKKCINILNLSEVEAIEFFVKMGDDSLTNLLSSKESVDYLINKVPDSLIAKIKFSSFPFLADEDKLRFLKNEHISKYNIISSLSDENLKLKLLNNLSSHEKQLVITNIKDDNIKKNTINVLKTDKVDIISSFNSDLMKEQYLNSTFRIFFKYRDIVNILASINDMTILDRNLFLLHKSFKNIILLNSDNISFNIKLKIIDKYLHKKDVLKCLKYIKRYDQNILYALLDKMDNISYEMLKIICIDLRLKKIDLIIDKTSPINLTKLISNYPNHIPFDYLKYIDNELLLIDTISQMNTFPSYSHEYKELFMMIANYYDINYHHLIKLAQLFDTRVLKYVTNLRDILKLNTDGFYKVINLFSNECITMDKETQNTIINSLLQKKFQLYNQETYNIYTCTLHAIENKNYNQVLTYMKEIFRVLDINQYHTNIQELVKGLVAKNPRTLKLYHDITSDYIKISRNNYIKHNLNNVINRYLELDYNNNEIAKYIINSLSTEEVLKMIKTNRSNNLLMDDELLKDIIEFKKGKKDNLLTKEFKKNLNSFNKIMDDVIEALKIHEIEINEIPKHYKLVNHNLNYDKIFQCMSMLQMDKLKEHILIDDNLYNDLLSYLKKYKFAVWERMYGDLCITSDVLMDNDTIVTFINNFDRISKKDLKSLSLASLVDYINLCSDDYSIYSYIFGIENYKLLKSNPGPFSGSLTIAERLEQGTNLLKQMKNRKYIAIPPINKTYTLNNNKSIDVVVGDIHDMINFTYGERTSSCMRLGGGGHSFFRFCLLNENGFHIRFVHPKTKQLISRVSGFRNGNTVFLNQLRYSLSKEYDSNDLQETCIKVANELIEATKKSKYPIENVVISKDYAFHNSSFKSNTLDRMNFKASLPNFYADVNNLNGIVIATNANKNHAPFKLGYYKSEMYPILRNETKIYTNKQAGNEVGHIEVLDQLFNGVDYKTIDLDILNMRLKDVILCCSKEDWYVSVDRFGIIRSYIMKNSNNYELACKECNIAKKVIEKRIRNSKEASNKPITKLKNITYDLSTNIDKETSYTRKRQVQ